MRLIADIGGTHARIGLVDKNTGVPQRISKLRCADFVSLDAALLKYVEDNGAAAIDEACIAVAGPVSGDRVKLTNLPWQFSQQQLQKALGVNYLAVINDFAAVAHAMPFLNEDDRVQFGGADADQRLPSIALGPGTGLGAAMLVSGQGRHQVIATEAGHVATSPESDLEQSIFRHCNASGSYIKREFFISGSGLEAIYQALCKLQSATAQSFSAAEIQQHACAGSDPRCEQALSVFCAWLGGVAADQALACGARGGVYIAGGMVKKFLDFFLRSEFRQRFENRGSMSAYLQAIPVYVITRDHVALLGAANVPLGDLQE